MKSMGQDASLLAVSLSDDGVLSVEDEPIGRVEGLRFSVDHGTSHADRKMLLAAGEKAMPRILSDKVDALLAADLAGVELKDGAIRWEDQRIAELSAGPSAASARLVPDRQLTQLPDGARMKLVAALEAWLAARMAPLAPLAKLEEASRDPAAGSEARALLLSLIAGHCHLTLQAAGLEHLPKETRPFLRRIGVTFGALDIFAAALLKPAPRQLLNQLGADPRPLNQSMIPVIASAGGLPTGYRHAGKQAVRIDIAEKIIRAAHDARGRSTRRKFILDPALAVSTGLTADSYVHLLGQAGFRRNPGRILAEGALGPPAPDQWEWHPSRGHSARGQNSRGEDAGRPQERSSPRDGGGPRKAAGKPRGKRTPPATKPAKPPVTRPAANPNSAFAGLADLLR